MATTFSWGGNTLTLDNNTTHILSEFKISSGPSRNVNQVNIARSNGSYVVDVNNESKVIAIEGYLVYSDLNSMEAEIDNMKWILAGDPLDRGFGILSYSWNGTTRECDAIVPDLSGIYEGRTGRDVTKTPYRFEFLVPSGEVRATSYTTETTTNATTDYTEATVSVSTATTTVQPIYEITGTDLTPASGTLTTMNLTNKTTSQSMTITPSAFTDGDIFTIDTNEKIVSQNQTLIDYSGIFPELIPGNNDLALTFTKGSTIVNSFTDVLNPQKNYGRAHGVNESAQSFSAGASTNINSVWIYIWRTDYSPATDDDLTIEIQTDNSGSPSGTNVTNASVDIPIAEIPRWAPGWVQGKFATAPAVTSGTTYWLVLSSPSMANQSYRWVEGSGSTSYKYSQDSGSTWTAKSGVMANYKLYENGGITGIDVDLDTKYIPKFL